MAKARVRLLLVDDHKVVRLGLARLFETVPDYSIVAEAGTVAEGISAARTYEPDVVLMDVRLPDGSGVEACREIRSHRPDTSVLMLTSYADEEALFASIIAGAAGYMLKDTEPTQIIAAIEVVARGGSLLDPTSTQTVLGWMRRTGTPVPRDPLADLSEHEQNILELIAEGKTNRQIGLALSLSESTVKTYVSNILQKLHLARRAEAAAFIARQQRAPGT